MTKLNLHTDGDELYIKGTTDEYVGYYNITLGVFYSGRSKSDESIELIPMPNVVVSYIEVADAEKPEPLVTFRPTPTKNDYKRGWFTRYFARQTNVRNSQYYEIDQSEYDVIAGRSKPIYTAVQLRWKISGPKFDRVDPKTEAIIEPGVYDTNVRSIKFLGEEHKRLQLRLQNKLEFYEGGSQPYFGPSQTISPEGKLTSPKDLSK